MLADKDAVATVAVKDLKVSRPFYEDKLGLKATDEAMGGVVTYATGKSSLLVYESEFAGTNRATSVTWSLGTDFDATVKALKDKGVAFEHYDMPGMGHDGDVHVAGGMRLAWFADPDGNIIHIGNFA